MSRLYAKISDLAVNDATVYQHLKMQEHGSMEDFDVAVALIRSLVHEKKSYFDHAVKTSQMSIVPMVIPKNAAFKFSLWERIKLWFRGLL